jgi:hypothetical protein
MVLTLNLTAFGAAIRGDSIASALREQTTAGFWQLVPVGVAILFTTIVNGQVSAAAKARIVFFKWRDPLPGSRAFSHYAKCDERVDVGSLLQKLGQLPHEPRQQNAMWYKMYRSVEAEPSVREAHQYFLFFRDYATLMVLLTIFLIPLDAYYAASYKPVAILGGLFLVQFLLACRAAQIHGKRLVCNVLAICSANGASE